MHIVLIGTKAQLVKMAPVIQALDAARMPYRFVLTGQHAETMQDLIDAFGIRSPDDTLVDTGEQDTGGKLLRWLPQCWRAAMSRDYLADATSILVHGDTLSTLLGAALGWRRGVTVAHIEAGLRSHNLLHPFPEEVTRLLVSRLSRLHFCPDSWAASNLDYLARKPGHKVIDTQRNTIIDSLRYALARQAETETSGDYAVVSLHRYENLSNGARFDALMAAVARIGSRLRVQFILHPITRRKLLETGWNERLRAAGIELRERMDYVSFMGLLANSRFLVTDGGSNQEEAAYMGLPCLLMRKATERKEGLGERAVLSNYDDDLVDAFVDDWLERRWDLRELPDIHPSAMICAELAQLPGSRA